MFVAWSNKNIFNANFVRALPKAHRETTGSMASKCEWYFLCRLKPVLHSTEQRSSTQNACMREANNIISYILVYKNFVDIEKKAVAFERMKY